MNKKLKYLILVVSALVITGVGTAAYRADFKLGRNVEMVVNIMKAVFLYYVDPVDADTLGKGAADGMLAELDPYTEFIPADDNDAFELMTTGRYGGIGSVIRQRGDEVLIAEPYRGTPSDRAGLEIGDVFVEIEGKSAKGMTTKDVSDALKGEPGTEVTIRVRKLRTGEVETLAIRREVIALPSVPFHGVVRDSVGYIRHSDFTEGSAAEVRAAFLDLKARGINGLILDYRGNGGGIMQEAIEILGMFVPRGTEVVSMRGRGAGTSRTYRTTAVPIDLRIPIAVLVDGSSASASEIVAGALQDLDRGVLLGQRTFGKGLGQSPMPLGDGATLKITTAKYYIPSGRCIQAIDYSTADSLGGGRPHAIADSLVKEFRTAGGRRVYDGGGVMPDIRLEPEYSSRFAYLVYAKGFVDDFADRWSVENISRDVTPSTFRLTDGDWDEFVAFLADKDLDYESATERGLASLRKSAEAERLLTPEITDHLAAIESALADDNVENLRLYRPEMERVIENAIVLRRHYSAGVARHNLGVDGEIVRAVELLEDGATYREILTSRDTDRR